MKTAGGFLAAAAVRANGAEVPVSPVMTRLSTYMSDAASHALPDEVVEKSKHHILDTFAAMISGADLPPGRVALRIPAASWPYSVKSHPVRRISP